MNSQVVRPMPLPALAIPFRIALTRVMPIAAVKEEAHRKLGSPNWRSFGEEHAI